MLRCFHSFVKEENFRNFPTQTPPNTLFEPCSNRTEKAKSKFGVGQGLNYGVMQLSPMQEGSGKGIDNKFIPKTPPITFTIKKERRTIIRPMTA